MCYMKDGEFYACKRCKEKKLSNREQLKQIRKDIDWWGGNFSRRIDRQWNIVKAFMIIVLMLIAILYFR
ncbi:hypothetical protein KL86DYS1_31151 [uncultured Dysgonomonas sp.]|uniref:Uncharacterized protein n=1 Tax=uncultured Dysgonomonas sp. TaxID=206096 RepID=A0A212K1U5_9BACT|nr:hypothetical protein KL86DYS1_31151 [uncultured Dysgonomonas sp.]